MALTTFIGLKSAVADYLGDDSLTTQIVDFVAMAEARIAYGSRDPTFPSDPLRIRAMEARTDLLAYAAKGGGTSGGSANAQTVTVSSITAYSKGVTVSFTAGFSNTSSMTFNVSALGAVTVYKGDGTEALEAGDVIAGLSYQVYHDGTNFRLITPGQVPLPTRYLEFRSLYLDTVPKGEINYRTPEQLTDIAADTTTGRPVFYTIEGDYIRFSPAPDGDYVVKASYYRKFAALSADADTNWLLTNYPRTYLDATMVEAKAYRENLDKTLYWMQRYKADIDSIIAANDRDRYSGSALVMATDTGNP